MRVGARRPNYDVTCRITARGDCRGNRRHLAGLCQVAWVRRGLGRETGFRISQDPDTVRAPDAAFICAERAGSELPEGFFPGPPDLAVEVLSPNDRASEVIAKVRDWLDAGCRAVWVVDPKTRTVAVYHGNREAVLLQITDTLGGGDLLPGFVVPVADLFAL